MKYNFSKIRITDLDSKKTPNVLHKSVANLLWHSAKTLDLVDIAIFINRGEEVDLDKSEIEELRTLIDDPNAVIKIWSYAKKAIFEYIDSVQEKEKNKHKKK